MTTMSGTLKGQIAGLRQILDAAESNPENKHLRRMVARVAARLPRDVDDDALNRVFLVDQVKMWRRVFAAGQRGTKVVSSLAEMAPGYWSADAIAERMTESLKGAGHLYEKLHFARVELAAAIAAASRRGKDSEPTLLALLGKLGIGVESTAAIRMARRRLRQT